MKALFDFILNLLDDWYTLPIAEEDEREISACKLSLSASRQDGRLKHE